MGPPRPRSRVAAGILGLSFCAPIAAQSTQLVSVDSNGVQGNYWSTGGSISADGRFVAFTSYATNLVPGDTNGFDDVFVRDRLGGVTERVSVDSNGMQANLPSGGGPISADGRYVAFTSLADNLVVGDTNGNHDVFVRDRLTGTTERVSVDSNGTQANGESIAEAISADGRFVGFSSDATNLVPGDTNGVRDVFVRDRLTGTTERVSVDSAGVQGNGMSDSSVISADGRFVAFSSRSSNLVPGDTNGDWDVFVHDRQTGTTERVSVDSNGAQAHGGWCQGPQISGDGRYVAFTALATNLVPGDSNGVGDVFLRDRQSGATERVSVATGGAQGNGYSAGGFLSDDGRFVAFSTNATNFAADSNGFLDVYLRDRQAGTTERVSVDLSGFDADGDSGAASMTPDGRYIAFGSEATNLVHYDANGYWDDVFVRDQLGGSHFTSLCDPSAGGVISCPCSNPPGGTGRGCDNSSGTGGASLTAWGGAFLSSDNLHLTTSGEKPTALSIVMQGTTVNSSGVVYGQGVRCVAGMLRRLYVKTAVAGSILAPNFGADPTVSASSAARGDVIQPGQSRWYLVYYRDPTVLGGCPGSSTFNSTQTGEVVWWP